MSVARILRPLVMTMRTRKTNASSRANAKVTRDKHQVNVLIYPGTQGPWYVECLCCIVWFSMFCFQVHCKSFLLSQKSSHKQVPIIGYAPK